LRFAVERGDCIINFIKKFLIFTNINFLLKWLLINLSVLKS
jgi:hypothetical protein